MILDRQILIVGGGPAGLSTWLHLHAIAPELARRAILIEKERYPREKLCGGGLTVIGDLLLRGLGIDLDCPSIPIRRVDIAAGDQIESFGRPGALRVICRREFDHALARAAVERGMELREESRFVGMVRETDRLKVRTSGEEISVRVVVAADGAQSEVRRSLGLGDDARLARLIEVLERVDPERCPEFIDQKVVFDFAPMAAGVQGYVWHFPCLENGQVFVNHGIYDSRLHPERTRADLRTVFGQALAAAGVRVEASAWKSHPVRWFGPPGRLGVPNVLLVGDAAGVDPLLGEGIAPSLDYGDLAARLLVDAFARNDFSFADSLEQAATHPLLHQLVRRGVLAGSTYAGNAPPPTAAAAIARALLGSND